MAGAPRPHYENALQLSVGVRPHRGVRRGRRELALRSTLRPMVALLRSIAAVILGYGVFAACAATLFALSGRAPHAPASPAFMGVTVASGVVFALAGGYVAASLAGRRPVAHAVAVAAVLAAGATVSLALTLGHGAIWSQVAALLVMAPSAVVGGWWRAHAV